MDAQDYTELNGIDGEAVELHKIRRKVAQNGIKPEEFKDRIICMSMYNDIDWSQGDENRKKCVSNSI